MSKSMIIIFIVEFFLLGVSGVVEKNYALALYGLGGAILNIGIFKMN